MRNRRDPVRPGAPRPRGVEHRPPRARVVASGGEHGDCGRCKAEVQVARLLIHETSYRRLRPDLDALPGLESVLIAGDGALSVDGEAVLPDETRPDIAVANGEGSFSPLSL